MSVAWFQSRYDKEGPGGSGADYINCPLTREQYDAFVDAHARRRQGLVPRVGSGHALFRRLPADRGDGGTRPRDAPARSNEAGRAHQSACADGRKPTPSCNCARTTSSAPCSTWSDSRPSSSTASRCASSAPSPGWRRAEFARLGGLHRNTFLDAPAAARSARCACTPSRGCVLPARSPAARVMSNPPRSGLMAGRFAAAERLGEVLAPPPATTAHGALLAHITGGHVEATVPGRALLSADERQFRPVSAAHRRRCRRADAGKRLRGTPKSCWPRRKCCAAARSPISNNGSPAHPELGGGVNRTAASAAQRVRAKTRPCAARHRIHCRRHCGSVAGLNGL